MSFITLLLLAIALSFDVMAVSAASGVAHSNLKVFKALKMALLFAFFHALMVFIGWLLGLGLEKIISGFDHWIAFILLAFLGLKTIFSKSEDKLNIHSFKVLLIMAVATSIDALVVGMTFALINLNVYYAALVISLTVFVLCLLSIYLGKVSGKLLGRRAEILGGLILIAIGLKILLTHLF